MRKLGGIKANGLQKREVLKSEEPSRLPKESKLYGNTGQGQSDSVGLSQSLKIFTNDSLYRIDFGQKSTVFDVEKLS